MLIRAATPLDWAAIWPFWQRIVAAGQTYSYDPDLTEDEACDLWMLAPPGR
ncbi:MAG: GNAT family N-acetyltransferase, partial [Actinomycetota bacterium]|nr:GNAT family N-acetyltransferase [Actinomycetota bacterium]